MNVPDGFRVPDTPTEKIHFKNELRNFALQVLEERMQNTRQLMNNAQAAANGEEKSSAGDKYETSRAMNHLQKDMHARQLAALQKEAGDLMLIDTGRLFDHPVPGACIHCPDVIFFIACGLAKRSVHGIDIFFVSPLAPLASQLMKAKIGDHFSWNAHSHAVSDIF